MKISFLIGSFGAGGKERQLLYLIKGLLENDCSTQLIVFNEGVFYKDIYKLPIEFVVLNRKDRYSLKTLKTVFMSLHDFKPDIIHSWDNISHS
ncbi:MAG: hypothetical protein ACOCUV_00975, partial [bacterium]